MSNIALKLRNDLALPVSLNVLGGTSDESNQNNADTLYEWNLATENFVNVDTVIVQSRLRGQTIYQNSSTSLSNFSFQGVALALSTLNLGNFLNDGSIIYTYNSDIEFADIILTLTNVPQPSGYTQLLYDHFVPVGTVLRQFLYPTVDAFESDYGPAITLLFQQTDAATGIDLYGPGCVYPVQGVDPTGVLVAFFRIELATSSPKTGNQRPILSGSFGTLQGYDFQDPAVPTTASNMFLYYPSGNANEVIALIFTSRNSHIFFFDEPYYTNLGNLIFNASRKKMTSQGMLNSLNLSQFEYNLVISETYPSGWTAPSVISNQLFTLNLDSGFGVQPAQIFTNPDDFVYTILPQGSTIEGYNNIKFNPSSLQFTTFSRNILIQFCSGVILGANMNFVFTNYDGTVVNNFDLGGSNDNVSWENLNSGLRWNGFSLIKLNGNNLSAFPPIQQMNRLQNNAPFTQFQINFNASGNNLPVNQVNQILVDFDQSALNSRPVVLSSTINLSGQIPSAPPSGAGISAKNALIARGITVITD